MKLINKLDASLEQSIYSGQFTRSSEMYLRPVPKYDENGKELKKSERYYVFRLLYFTGEDRNYPFIVRDEHTFMKKDFSGNIKEVKRICCPNTIWARNKIQEKVDRDYCPICKYSFEQNVEGWKNYKSLGQIDSTCLKLSKDTQRQQAVYIPVLVISDPVYKNNNNHFRVLRLSGEEGMSAFARIKAKILEANNLGISVFNGEEGANIAILCEKMQKEAKKRNGETIYDKVTDKPKTYMANCITDVQLMTKRLHSYNIITEANLEKLAFDETYGTAATKEQLQAFLFENYLDNGASDSDFDEEFTSSENDFDNVEDKHVKNTKKSAMVDNKCGDDSDDVDETSDITSSNQNVATDVGQEVEDDSEVDINEDEDFVNETPREAIARITKSTTHAASKKVVSAVMDSMSDYATNRKQSGNSKGIVMKSHMEAPKDTDAIRDNSLDVDFDDLPF